MSASFLFPDPRLAVLDALRPALAARSEPEAAGVTVGTVVPFTGEPGYDPALPYVLVAVDGSTVAQRVVEETTIRLTVWHRSEDLGDALARLCRALLVAHRGPTIRSATALSGPIPAGDPDSGAPLSFLTLSVRTRPTSNL